MKRLWKLEDKLTLQLQRLSPAAWQHSWRTDHPACPHSQRSSPLAHTHNPAHDNSMNPVRATQPRRQRGKRRSVSSFSWGNSSWKWNVEMLRLRFLRACFVFPSRPPSRSVAPRRKSNPIRKHQITKSSSLRLNCQP